MTREEAIAIIENEKECVNRANKNDYCNRDCYNCELVKTDTEILTALDMAIKALEQEERWILVSERLPEENITVIGITKFDDVYKTELYDDCGKKKWYANCNFDVPIVAWIPFPEQPCKKRK